MVDKEIGVVRIQMKKIRGWIHVIYEDVVSVFGHNSPCIYL